jgi:hypothetical protein
VPSLSAWRSILERERDDAAAPVLTGTAGRSDMPKTPAPVMHEAAALIVSYKRAAPETSRLLAPATVNRPVPSAGALRSRPRCELLGSHRPLAGFPEMREQPRIRSALRLAKRRFHGAPTPGRVRSRRMANRPLLRRPVPRFALRHRVRPGAVWIRLGALPPRLVRSGLRYAMWTCRLRPNTGLA